MGLSTNIHWQFEGVSTNIYLTVWECMYKYSTGSLGVCLKIYTWYIYIISKTIHMKVWGHIYKHTLTVWAVSTNIHLTVWGCIYKYTPDRLKVHLQIYTWLFWFVSTTFYVILSEGIYKYPHCKFWGVARNLIFWSYLQINTCVF